MRRRAGRQRGQIVAALEGRDDAAPGVPPGHLEQLLGDPGIVALIELQLRQRIAPMRIEPGGDQQHLGAKFVERRQDRAAEPQPELA